MLAAGRRGRVIAVVWMRGSNGRGSRERDVLMSSIES